MSRINKALADHHEPGSNAATIRKALLSDDMLQKVAESQRKVLARSALIADVDMPIHLALAALKAALEGIDQ